MTSLRELKKGRAPVKRFRIANSIWTLRLFVDLYHAQNLRDDGGVSPWVLRQNFVRMNVGEQGLYQVWAFKPGTSTLHWTGPFLPHRQRMNDTAIEDALGGKEREHPVWKDLWQIQAFGLLSFVPYLWERNVFDEKQQKHVLAEPIHAYGMEGTGAEPIELEIGAAAHSAALCMGAEWELEKARDQGYDRAAPVRSDYPHVALIGVPRLRYRPRTNRTAEWYGEMHRSAQVLKDTYMGLAQSALGARERVATMARVNGANARRTFEIPELP